MDREARMALYAQAEQIMIDEAPLIPISTSGNYAAVATSRRVYVQLQRQRD